jgi:hypothetical protein
MPHRNKRVLIITDDSLFREQMRNSRFVTKHKLKHRFIPDAVTALEKLRDPTETAFDFVVHAVEHSDEFIPLFLIIRPRPPLVFFSLGKNVSHCDADIGFVSSVNALEAYLAIHLFHAPTK